MLYKHINQRQYHWWNKIGTGQWLSWQSNAMQIQVEVFRSTKFSGHWIWHYAADAPVDQAPLPTTPTLGPGTSWLDQGSIEDSCLVGWITINTSMAVSRYAVFQANSWSTNIQQVIGQWRWQYYAVKDALIGPLVVIQQTMQTLNYLNSIENQLHSYMTSVFPTGIPARSRSTSQGSTCDRMVPET